MPRNPGGWIVWVAIADVAAYVARRLGAGPRGAGEGQQRLFPRPGRADAARAAVGGPLQPARGRGRAPAWRCGWCSTRTGRKRSPPVRARPDALGRQAVLRAGPGGDRRRSPTTPPARCWSRVLKPLWAAYAAMKVGRDRRSPLEIESAERRIVIGPEGEVVSITPAPSLEAHKLIEEMMVQANVCAAETLEQRRTPLIYRVHDTPSQEKIQALADFLGTLGVPWNKGEAPRTDRFNRLLAQMRDGPHAEIVNEVVLRTQMQAIYSTDNIGHFGLNLDRYAHFTSPIRRYADLIGAPRR